MTGSLLVVSDQSGIAFVGTVAALERILEGLKLLFETVTGVGKNPLLQIRPRNDVMLLAKSRDELIVFSQGVDQRGLFGQKNFQACHITGNQQIPFSIEQIGEVQAILARVGKEVFKLFHPDAPL